MDYRKIDSLLLQNQKKVKDLIQYIKMSESGYYRMIENKSMKVETLELIARFFRVSPGYFFHTDENSSEKSGVDVFRFVKNEEMQPKFLPGDKLELREVPEWDEFPPFNQIVYLVLKNGQEIFRYMLRDEDPEVLRLRATDPISQDIPVPKDRVKDCFMVIGFERGV